MIDFTLQKLSIVRPDTAGSLLYGEVRQINTAGFNHPNPCEIKTSPPLSLSFFFLFFVLHFHFTSFSWRKLGTEIHQSWLFLQYSSWRRNSCQCYNGKWQGVRKTYITFWNLLLINYKDNLLQSNCLEKFEKLSAKSHRYHFPNCNILSWQWNVTQKCSILRCLDLPTQFK